MSSRHCRRARRFSRQIVMARPAPLVARSTATRHSRAESPERPTRASRETDGADFVARKPMGRNQVIFQQIYTGQMTVRDSRKFAQKFARQKSPRKFAKSEFAPEQIFEQKKLYGRFLDRRLRVQNLLKNLLSFLPTGLIGNISPQLR